jgi:excisionase family DNA binding protein
MVDRLLKADQVGLLLGVSRFRVYELARTSVLPVVRLGRQVKFSEQALAEFIAAGGKGLDPHYQPLSRSGSPPVK